MYMYVVVGQVQDTTPQTHSVMQRETHAFACSSKHCSPSSYQYCGEEDVKIWETSTCSPTCSSSAQAYNICRDGCHIKHITHTYRDCYYINECYVLHAYTWWISTVMSQWQCPGDQVHITLQMLSSLNTTCHSDDKLVMVITDDLHEVH